MYDLHSLPICADLTPAILFQRANKAAYSCLKSWEGSVQVSLAALELMAGLSRLHIENISETTPLLLVWSVRLHQPTSSLLPNILPPLFPCPLSPSLFSSFLHSFPVFPSLPQTMQTASRQLAGCVSTLSTRQGRSIRNTHVISTPPLWLPSVPSSR